MNSSHHFDYDQSVREMEAARKRETYAQTARENDASDSHSIFEGRSAQLLIRFTLAAALLGGGLFFTGPGRAIKNAVGQFCAKTLNSMPSP